MFVYSSSNGMVILLLYIDDIIIITLTLTLLEYLIDSLKIEFCITDLGQRHYFLGVVKSNKS